MIRTWAHEAIARIGRGEPLALVTLTDVQGSAPRDAGARMLVWADGQHDTIGGGNLEFMVVREAQNFLAHRRPASEEPRRGESHAGEDAGGPSGIERDYPLGPILGQCCGGKVRVRIERLDESRVPWIMQELMREAQAKDVVGLFGAGHVGQAIARALEPLPFWLQWCDTRPAYAGEAALIGDPRAVIAEMRAGAYFLIVTHNHDLDYEIVRAVLERGDAAYCGLIGSVSKRKRFERQLRADGLGHALARLTCPIGGAVGIKGKEPAIIAASAVAELLLVREQRAVMAEHAHAE